MTIFDFDQMVLVTDYGRMMSISKQPKPTPQTQIEIPLKCMKAFAFCRKKWLINAKSWTRDGQGQNL